MMASANTASGDGRSTTVQVHRTPLGGSRESLSSFTLVLGQTDTFSTNYSYSTFFAQGDLLHVHVTGYGSANTLHDLTLQLDMF